MQIIVCLLTVGFALLTDARLILPNPPSESPGETVIFSSDLSPDHTPCRYVECFTSGYGLQNFPCGGGIERCTTQEEFAAFVHGPQPHCPIFENPTPILQEETCALVDGECTFTTEAPTCVSWLPNCATQYTCTTEEVYLARSNTTCSPVFLWPQPTPASVCVPVDGGCEWHDPCTIWQDHCEGDYRCGSQADLAYFNSSPFIPLCAAPDPINPRPEPVPEGECVYRDGQCEWSQCRAYLGGCQTSWNCGNEYEFLVHQSLPPPPCANPGPFFRPPIQPGMCKYNIELGGCAFDGIVVCEGGREYRECGSPCPRTCDNIFEPDFCLSVCSAGCFCPDGTVLHNDQCIPLSECPDLCEGCEPDQECKLQQVQCIQAPCPPQPICQDKATVDVQSSESGLTVTVASEGARLIRVLVRDSSNNRHTERVLGSPATVTFSGLPSGLTHVRAIVRRQNGERFSTKWVEIVL